MPAVPATIVVGKTLQAKYRDGSFRKAEVLDVSSAKKRQSAPVKVRFVELRMDAWLAVADLRVTERSSSKRFKKGGSKDLGTDSLFSSLASNDSADVDILLADSDKAVPQEVASAKASMQAEPRADCPQPAPQEVASSQQSTAKELPVCEQPGSEEQSTPSADEAHAAQLADAAPAAELAAGEAAPQAKPQPAAAEARSELNEDAPASKTADAAAEPTASAQEEAPLASTAAATDAAAQAPAESQVMVQRPQQSFLAKVLPLKLMLQVLQSPKKLLSLLKALLKSLLAPRWLLALKATLQMKLRGTSLPSPQKAKSLCADEHKQLPSSTPRAAAAGGC